MATRTTDHPPAPVRARVADSWVRSAAAGVLAETVEAPVTLGDHDLRDYREAHPLAAVFPLLDDVLGQSARECDAVMAVSDAAEQLLWVCGTPTVLRRAERNPPDALGSASCVWTRSRRRWSSGCRCRSTSTGSTPT